MRVVFCTCPPDEAKSLAQRLVEERLIACANILPGVTSVYRWEGAICEDDETPVSYTHLTLPTKA